MKKLSISILLFALISCSTEKPNENVNNKKAIQEIKDSYGESERFVEVMLTDADVLYISVRDNGVDQSQFAHTICNVLKSNNATTKWVKIVKANSSNDPNADNSYGVLLGDCHCN
jgi:uncharacterized protein YbbC (DUF1343 family)